MSIKELYATPNILTPILDGYQLKGGDILNIVGLIPADTNLLMESFFQAVVNTPPQEDEEEKTGILYLTRSHGTALRIKRSISGLNSANKVIVRTYRNFNGEEILELLANLEDDLVFRHVFIEDIDLTFASECGAQLRKIRDSNQGYFLLTVSSGMGLNAHGLHELDNPTDGLLIAASNLSYDKSNKLSTEVDVQIIAIPDVWQIFEGQVLTRCVMSKRRGPNPYEKLIHSIFLQ